MKIKIIRTAPIPPGAIVEISDSIGKSLIQNGKAEPVMESKVKANAGSRKNANS